MACEQGDLFKSRLFLLSDITNWLIVIKVSSLGCLGNELNQHKQKLLKTKRYNKIIFNVFMMQKCMVLLVPNVPQLIRVGDKIDLNI